MPEFELTPFPSGKTPDITFTGNAGRRGNQLSIRYKINENIDQIVFPAPTTSPSRKHDLWKATCFEFFIAIPGQPPYWEFNMSPSGDWNIYKMDAYRQVNMREEQAITQFPFEFKSYKNMAALNVSVNLDPIIRRESKLQIGVATIIQTRDGGETYWALDHSSPQADFHRRESFSLSL